MQQGDRGCRWEALNPLLRLVHQTDDDWWLDLHMQVDRICTRLKHICGAEGITVNRQVES